MKLFISWSGQKSGAVAAALREWLPFLFQSLDPWMSRADIDAGARWNQEVQEQLAQTNFGILCLTRENFAAPWLLFEAGAVAKAVTGSAVVPYLIDLDLPDLPSGPLTQFQAKRADRQGTWDLVKGINANLKQESREPEKLERIFDRWWPDLEKVLVDLPGETMSSKQSRPVAEMVEEILLAVRGLERQMGVNALPPSVVREFLTQRFLDLSPGNPSSGKGVSFLNLEDLGEEERRVLRKLAKRREGDGEKVLVLFDAPDKQDFFEKKVLETRPKDQK